MTLKERVGAYRATLERDVADLRTGVFGVIAVKAADEIAERISILAEVEAALIGPPPWPCGSCGTLTEVRQQYVCPKCNLITREKTP